ncbi:MAG: tyrosine-type recombinase/integrase, partial [Thiobacillaceae bacterium]
MGRRKTVHKDLPPRMVARLMAKGRRLYYYNGADGTRIPLGDDLNLARMKWAEIEANHSTGVHTFHAIAERYRREVLPQKAAKTQREQNKELDRLIAVFGKVQINDIRPMHIRQYLDKRSAKVAANREVALLSHIWTTARGVWGYTEKDNPCTRIRNKETPRGVYVDDAEFFAVLDHADVPLRDAMLLAYYTGQRLADVLKMTRTHIKEGALWIVQNKTKKRLAISIEGELEQVINAMLRRERSATSIYLIQTDAGRPLTYSMLRNRFDDARDKAGVDFQFRDIRPKAATDSGSLAEAQALLGHQSSATTQRHYRHIERVKPVR